MTARYLAGDQGTSALRLWEEGAKRPGDGVASLVSVGVLQGGKRTATVDIRQPMEVEMVYGVHRPGNKRLTALSFFDPMGVHLFTAADFAETEWSALRPAGGYRSPCRVPGNLFAEVEVRVVAEVSTRSRVNEIHLLVLDSVASQVVDKSGAGSVRAGWGRPIPGVMRPMCDWAARVGPQKDSAQPRRTGFEGSP